MSRETGRLPGIHRRNKIIPELKTQFRSTCDVVSVCVPPFGLDGDPISGGSKFGQGQCVPPQTKHLRHAPQRCGVFVVSAGWSHPVCCPSVSVINKSIHLVMAPHVAPSNSGTSRTPFRWEYVPVKSAECCCDPAAQDDEREEGVRPPGGILACIPQQILSRKDHQTSVAARQAVLIKDGRRPLARIHGPHAKTKSRTKLVAGLARISCGFPTCSMRPIDITTTRSASSIASS